MPSHYEGNPDEVRALSALINLLRCAASVSTRTTRHLAAHQLTLPQFAVLEAILHCGPANQTEISRRLLTSNANVTFVIDGLESRGLVERERSATDRRCLTVCLTDTGRELISAVFPEHAKVIAREFSVLTSTEQDELRRLCRLLGRGEGPDKPGEDCE